jgi:hypothetical protein
MQSEGSQPTFQRNSRGAVSKQSLLPDIWLVTCLAYPSTLKMEAICFSETSVDFHRSTPKYIPEHRTVHGYRYENLKSSILGI